MHMEAVIIDQERRVYGIFLEYEFCISWRHLINIYSNHQRLFSGHDFHNFNYASEFLGVRASVYWRWACWAGVLKDNSSIVNWWPWNRQCHDQFKKREVVCISVDSSN